MQSFASLLSWYDAHARDMPWRVAPSDRKSGIVPDPYHVWLSEVMLQQTTVVAVVDYFNKFIGLWPDVSALAAADDADVMAAWAGLGYYARARNLLKCARVITDQYDGQFPDDPAALLKLPGIGPYTAASLSAIAFDLPETVLDGNVERVMARQYAITKPLPDCKEDLRVLAASRTPKERAGDYAQAVMDLGATSCTPKSPKCDICPWLEGCKAHAQGIEATLPKKRPKPEKPIRVGVAYVVHDGIGVLLETRPDKGLLGGMLGWPGSDWAVEQVAHDPPIDDVHWMTLNETVRHTFTHFHLYLTVKVAHIDTDLRSDMVDLNRFDANSLPTVMRKVWMAAKRNVING